MMDEDDPTKLTSFQPLNPVSSASTFSLSRLLAFGRKKSTPQLPECSSTKDYDSPTDTSVSQDQTAVEVSDSSKKKENLYAWLSESASNHKKVEEVESSIDERITKSLTENPRKWRYRNVRTILRRFSTLTIDRRWHQSTGDFKHNFKQYWMPDEHCKECYECSDKFNTFRRRHHCRVCGQIFCYRCCSQEVSGKVMGFSGDIRVCTYCFNIVQAYLSDDFDKNIAVLNEEVSWKVGEHSFYETSVQNSNSLTAKANSFHTFEESPFRVKVPTRTPSANSLNDRAITPVQRFPFDAFGVAPSEANNIKQDYKLRELWRQLTDPRIGLKLESHRFRMKTHENCLIGSEMIDWLLAHKKCGSRNQGIRLLQSLLDVNWITCLYATDDNTFKDEYMLYQPTKMALAEIETTCSSNTLHHHHTPTPTLMMGVDDDPGAPKWFKQIKHTSLDAEEIVHQPTGYRFSSGRLLDLDQIRHNADESETDLSIQMTLNAENVENSSQKDPMDQISHISLITSQPPVPLDHWTLVEATEPSKKKKLAKQNSAFTLTEDILHGVVFPRPTNQISREEEDEDGQTKNDASERLAKDRLRFAVTHHLKTLLVQLLEQDHLPLEWEAIIMPFISKISEKVMPDAHRDDDMDIRRYVWIRKIAGGKKSDSHLVSGVVLSKNISHKRMVTRFAVPKILMMRCGVEYQRQENKMASLDPIVLQEQAFLQNFVRRVLDLKPNIFIVEKNVARKAQEMLLNGGVTLIHNVKPDVMENIARCTCAEILLTMEQITKPRLGTCQSFHLEKFQLPNGESKTLMYFDGCAPDLGCSLVLRGSPVKTLLKVKKIIKYLIYVAYHAKLEVKFLMDEFAMPPALDHLSSHSKLENDLVEEFNLDEKVHDNDSDSDNTSETEMFGKLLQRVLLSSSPFLHYSQPYLLTEEGARCSNRCYIAERIYWSHYLDGSRRKTEGNSVEETPSKNQLPPEVRMKPAHVFTDPSILLECDKDSSVGLLNDFRARGGRLHLKIHDEYEDNERRKVYGPNWKKAVTSDDESVPLANAIIPKPPVPNEPFHDPKMDCFDTFNHQKLAVLFSSHSSESNNAPKPCISPWPLFMEFYGRNDITLGGFLERYCFRPSYICPSHNCDVPMVNHVRYFAHSTSSLYIHMRNLGKPIPGYDRTILTWSWCKVCKQVTPVVPLSWESYSLSFAKYLELRFYGHAYTRRASAEPCTHSLHHDHYQYFSFANMVASFKYRAIDLYEVIIPSDFVTIGKQKNTRHLLDEINEINDKVESVINTIMERILALKANDTNSNRNEKIKEFISDVQKEKSNMQHCGQVIATKTKSLVRSTVQERGFFLGADDQVDDQPAQDDLSNEEVQALLLDVNNKLFHLRKNICECVEKWNIRIPEFIQQDRKREKRSVSPMKISLSGSEFNVESSVELEHARPRTLTNLSLKEPTTEVHLDNGTILRQTYFGNTPTLEQQHEDMPTKPIDVRSKLGSPYTVIKSLPGGTAPPLTTSPVGSPRSGTPIGSPPSGTPVGSPPKGGVDMVDCPNVGIPSAKLSANTSESSLKTDVDDIADTSLIGSAKSKDDALTEFPHIKEENLEKVEYLTPNEVKAMLNARRLRLEWESKKKSGQQKLPESSKKEEDGVGQNTKKPSKDALSKSVKSSAKEKSSKEKESKKEAKEKEKAKDKLKDKSPKKAPLYKRILSSTDLNSTSTKVKSKSSKSRKSSQSENISTEPEKPIERKRTLLKKSEDAAIDTSSIKPNTPVKSDAPVKAEEEVIDPLRYDLPSMESETEVKLTSSTQEISKEPYLYVSKTSSSSPAETKPAATAESTKSASSEALPRTLSGSRVTPKRVPTSMKKIQQSQYQRQKQMGHRRLRSAPHEIVHSLEVSGTGSPFLNYGADGPFDRQRSRSFGMRSSEKEELSKMAEKVCQEDRMRDERDDPEVVQIDGKENLSVALTQSGGSSASVQDNETNEPKLKPESDIVDSKLTTSGEVATQKRGEKFKNIISTFLPNIPYQPIPRPFPSYMHYMTQIDASSTIIINEKEPTSLIAFTLSCPEYQKQLKNIQDMISGKPTTLFTQPPPTPPPPPKRLSGKEQVLLRKSKFSDKHGLRPNSWAGTTDVQQQDDYSDSSQLSFQQTDEYSDHLEDSGMISSQGETKKRDKSSLDHHIKLQFQDENVARFYCSVYYAEQFRQLRELIFPEKEERYIQSLARCKFWKATGGKSGSSFSKSLDDRFVMKQMSRPEIQSFVEFAPKYFEYMNKAIKEKRPTAMAKLLGVYRIGFNNPSNNIAMRQDVLVMENVFYEKTVNKIFDLKGSVRGRYVQTSVKEDVLMDENLLEMISESPLFIRPHSKAVLSKAIHNDTEFLSSNMVMDYSLLVGIDQNTRNLVVGIIDFIRTYTWDKRLESWVKSTGILGGYLPTVVSPDVYRTRFTEAMQRYFLMVPDKWTGFGADLN